jgi:hypothetical protein
MTRSSIHRCEYLNCGTGKEHADRAHHHQVNLLLSRLNEPPRRWFAALEAMHIGHGCQKRFKTDAPGVRTKTWTTWR